MIASEFIYDNIITGLTLSYPVYLGAAAHSGTNDNLPTSYITLMDIGGSSNPAYLRDVYTVDFIGRFEKAEYEQGLLTMYALRDGILGHPNIVDGSGNIWCQFLLTRAPQFTNIDGNGKTVITMIFEVTVDSSSGTYRQSIQ